MTRRDWESETESLAAEAIAQGQPNAWFDRLYGAAREGQITMPWEHDDPHPVLADWLARGTGRPSTGRAAVIGCGLGADAEALAAEGFETVGFDLSESAIAEARSRHPESSVTYVVGDLLNPPADWHEAFDVVVEIYTVQAVPPSMRPEMTAGVADLLAPGGALLVLQMVLPDGEEADGPPWPLTRGDMENFERQHGLRQTSLEVVEHPRRPGRQLWRGQFTRPATTAP